MTDRTERLLSRLILWGMFMVTVLLIAAMLGVIE
jgi:hypothetical protein